MGRQPIVGMTYVCAAGVVTIAALTWPDAWTIPAPLGAVFGPVLAMQLGWDSPDSTFFRDGILAAAAVFALILPFVFRHHWITIVLLILGVMLWSVVGIMMCRVLWA